MMKKLLVFLVIGFITIAFAGVGRVTGVKGEALVERAGKTLQVINAMQVEKNDVIKTLGDARVKLTFNDNTVISLGKKAVFNIAEYIHGNENTSKATFNVMQGAFKAITGKIGKVAPKKFIVKTRNATIGIRGTIFLGRVYPNADKEDIACTKGAITVTANGVSLDVDAGNYVTLDNGKNSGVKPLDSQVQDTLEEDVSLGDADEGDNSKAEKSDKKTKEDSDDDKEEKSDKDKKDKSNSGKKTSSTDDLSEESDSKTSDESSSTNNGKSTSSSSNISTDLTASAESAADTASTTTTDATSSTTTDTTTSTVNSATNLKGYQYSGYKLLSAATNNFIGKGAVSFKYDATTSKYTAQNYSLSKIYNGGTTGTTTVSSSFTHTPTNSIKKGGYTGHSAIADTMALNFTNKDGTSNTFTYNLEMDNMGEFLVGYELSSTDKVYDVFYAGSQSDATGLDTSKVYLYSEFKSNQVVLDDSNQISDAKDDTKTNTIYLNGKLRVIVPDDQLIDAGGAKDFLSIYVKDDGSVTGKEYYKHYSGTGGSYSATSVGSPEAGAIYGTDFQGLGVSMLGKEYSSYGVGNTLVNTDYSTHTAYLSSTAALSASKISSQTMKGYVSYGISNPGTAGISSSTNSDGLTLTVNSSTGAIDGTVVKSGAIDIAMSGTIAGSTSYYLNDDAYGVMMKNSSGSVTNGGTTYNYIDNSGWFVSRADKYNSTSGAFEVDNSDYSSWGYWTGDFKDNSNNVKNIDIGSTWVAGVETNAASIGDLITKIGSSTPTYKGHILGYVTDSSSNKYNIKMDANNKVEIAFDLSDASSTATVNAFQFTDSNGQDHGPTGMEVKNITSSGFDIAQSSTVKGSGTFYGPNAQSIGGSFSGIQDTISSTNYTTTGVIKATKQ